MKLLILPNGTRIATSRIGLYDGVCSPDQLPALLKRSFPRGQIEILAEVGTSYPRSLMPRMKGKKRMK